MSIRRRITRPIRRGSTALPIALLLALLAPAPAVLADEVGHDPDLTLENVELLPIHDADWARLLHTHRRLVSRLHLLGKRAERVAHHLRGRDRKDDAGSRKLVAELERIARTMQPDLDRLREVLLPLGITADVLSAVRDAPTGSRRVERHAIRLVARAPGLDPSTRALHDRLGPAVEGALLGLDALRTRSGADEATAFQRAENGLLERFWRVVDATLDREQRRWLRRRLPTRIAKAGDLLAHVFVLPDLSPSQGARLKSLLVRMEAESAPDQAAVKRAEKKLASDEPGDQARRRSEREKEAAEQRLLDRFVGAWQRGWAVLTPEQRRELEALPPLLTPQQRVGDLKVDLAGIDLRPEQGPRLEELRRRYAPVKGEMVQRLMAIEALGEGYGPDSPQRDAVELLRYQAFGRALAAGRRAAHDVFAGVLTPDQIVEWVVVGTRGGPRD